MRYANNLLKNPATKRPSGKRKTQDFGTVGHVRKKDWLNWTFCERKKDSTDQDNSEMQNTRLRRPAQP